LFPMVFEWYESAAGPSGSAAIGLTLARVGMSTSSTMGPALRPAIFVLVSPW
jgi:hypothetical protein